MPSFKDILTTRFLPVRPQLGLTVMRVTAGAVMFLRHGLEKQPAHWSAYWTRFEVGHVDPIGIGPHATLIVTIISDLICSSLIVVGLGTRWAAMFCFGNIFVAWACQLHFAILGKTDNARSGEHILLYLGAMVMLMIAGPGKFSLDHLIAGSHRQLPED